MPWFSRAGGRWLAAILSATLAVSVAAAPTLRAWRDGPVRGLLTDEEYRRFGNLRTDSARRAFIERFWRDRDRDRGGSQGDSQEAFERRCEAANARFSTGAEEGWRTDRGQIYLLLGEPSSIRHEPGDVHSIDREIWTYGVAADAPETSLKLVFYRCEDGSVRLDPFCAIDLDPTSVAYDDERADAVRRVRDANPAYRSGRLPSMIADLLAAYPELERAAHPPPGAAPSSQTESPLPEPSAAPPARRVGSDTYFFRATDGSILTLLTLDLEEPASVAPDPVEGPAARAYVGSVSLGEIARRASGSSLASLQTVALMPAPGEESGKRSVLFGRVHLRGGRTYAARWTVRDTARDEIRVRRSLVGVPDLSSGFQASSIVPAEQFGPAGVDSGPFQVGSEAVVPRPGGVFRRGELLRLYLQVYEAAIDAVTSKPRVDVVFRFYRTEGGSARRQGKPFSVRGATGASMGLALPIGDWPVGSYRVEVELRDRVAGRRTSAEGRFSIVED